MTSLSHLVMEYIEPMISPATGELLRAEAWRAISCMNHAPNGLELATRLASASGGTVLTLPYDEANALGHSWISQREMDLLVSLSDEMTFTISIAA